MLYTFVACIILPRITNILKERKRVIDADLSSAHELDNKIDDLQIRTEKLRKEANHQYQTKLDETAKNAAKEREKLIEELKEKIEPDSIHFKDKSIQRPKKIIQAKSLTAKNYTVKLPNFKRFLNRTELKTSLTRQIELFDYFWVFFVKSSVRFNRSELQN